MCMKCDFVIKNGYIYVDHLLLKKDIGINDGIIVKVDDKIDDCVDFVDATNCIVMPGFINTHIHFGEYYIKGYDKKLSTSEYIEYAEKINLDNINNKELMRITSSKICAYEAISYGQTTLMGIRGWNALEDYNIRLYMGYPLMKSNKLKEYLDNPFEQFEKFKNDRYNTYYIFVHSLLMVDENILKALSNYLKHNNILLAIHLKETKEEEKKIINKYGLGSIELLEKYDLLSNKTLLVHCCYLNDKDIEIIRNHNCTISINPNSNLKLKNRIININKLKNINVCIGTDGVATNDSLNIIDSVKTLGLLYDISSEELIDMITINPNIFLNNNIGKICVGYKADFNIYDLNNYKIVRKESFINNLVYSSNINPKYVIVDGKYIVKNYNNIKLNEIDVVKMNISDNLKFNK